MYNWANHLGLMEIAVRHWWNHHQIETVQLLQAGTFLDTMLNRVNETHEAMELEENRILKARGGTSAAALEEAWELVREDYLLIPGVDDLDEEDIDPATAKQLQTAKKQLATMQMPNSKELQTFLDNSPAYNP